MILLPRFYIETDNISENTIEEKRNARFVDSGIKKSEKIKIYHKHLDNNRIRIDNIDDTSERYIIIKDKIYKKNKNDKMLSELATYISRYYKIRNMVCLLPIKMNNDSILINQQYTDETYILFRSFEELYVWLKKYRCDFCIKEYFGPNHIIDNQNCINGFYKIFERWFENSNKDILLLKTAPYIRG